MPRPPLVAHQSLTPRGPQQDLEVAPFSGLRFSIHDQRQFVIRLPSGQIQNILFLAMARFRLGEVAAARALLEELRALLEEEGDSADSETLEFFREAEALIGG